MSSSVLFLGGCVVGFAVGVVLMCVLYVARGMDDSPADGIGAE